MVEKDNTREFIPPVKTVPEIVPVKPKPVKKPIRGVRWDSAERRAWSRILKDDG